jgi:hypothetical protein
MEPFCYHLCANENVCFVRFKLPVQVLCVVFFASGVPIHSKRSDAGQDGMERSFHMFGSKSFELERFCRSTFWAVSWHFSGKIAKMTAKMVVQFMEGESQIAMGTFHSFAAAAASLVAVVASPIEENERLLSCLTPLFQCFEKGRRKMGESPRPFEFSLHVHNLYGGHLS